MFKMFVCAFIFLQGACFIDALLRQQCRADNQYDWSYHGRRNGPDVWQNDYPDCGKEHQSPINIDKRFVWNSDDSPLSFDNFAKPITKATVKNVGWTILVIPEDDETRNLTFRNSDYTLDGVHFHFGTKRDPGAEHLIENTRHEMEIHFAMHREEDNKVLVLARILKLDQDTDALNPITDIVSDIMYRDDSTELQSELDISGLLPEDNGSFYFYLGSNAIPPCQPSYYWLILKDIGSVGDGQLDKFTAAYEVGEDDASDQCRMGPNYRPEQKLGHNRRIFASK